MVERENDFMSTISKLNTSTWALTVLCVGIESGLFDKLATPKKAEDLSKDCGIPTKLVESILDVVVSLGFSKRKGELYYLEEDFKEYFDGQVKEYIVSNIRSHQLQSEQFYRNFLKKKFFGGWDHTDSEIINYQGRLGSVEMVNMFAKRILPEMDGLPEKFNNKEEIHFLDVGTGVGALSVAMVNRWPNMRIIAIEPAEVSFNKAKENIKDITSCIELRCQLVEDLIDEEKYDLVWLPQVFISPKVLPSALEIVWRSLKPGGWIWLPALRSKKADLNSTVLQLRNVLWSGDLLLSKELIKMLNDYDFTLVKEISNKPGFDHVYVIAQRPLI